MIIMENLVKSKYTKLFNAFLYNVDGGIMVDGANIPTELRHDILNDVGYEAQIVTGCDVALVHPNPNIITEATLITPQTDINANIGQLKDTLFLLDLAYLPTFMPHGDAFETAIINLLTYYKYKFIGFGYSRFTTIYL